jgi:subtilisin-like proprotein convertase family protein
MKRILTLVAAGMMWAGAATAQTQSTNFTFSTGATIPDNEPSGLALAYSLSGIVGTISDVTVSLSISGGYNGDLYAYLAGPNGGFTVLLNRVGVGTGAGQSTYGYADTGFNVTLDDTALNNIQYYQSASPAPTITGGVLQGTWQPDGVNIDPQSAPSAFTAGSPSTPLSSFIGTDPNGTWTLFLADLAAGNESVVGPITVDVTTVPEPQTFALAACGGLAILLLRNLRRSNS